MPLRAYENARLLECSAIPVHHIHGIARAVIIGPNAHIVSFRYMELLGEIVKVPEAEIIRPSDLDIAAEINRMLRRARAAVEGGLH
jgi:hypothetical protein